MAVTSLWFPIATITYPRRTLVFPEIWKSIRTSQLSLRCASHGFQSGSSSQQHSLDELPHHPDFALTLTLLQVVVCGELFWQQYPYVNADLDAGKPEPATPEEVPTGPPVNIDAYMYTGSILLSHFLHILSPKECKPHELLGSKPYAPKHADTMHTLDDNIEVRETVADGTNENPWVVPTKLSHLQAIAKTPSRFEAREHGPQVKRDAEGDFDPQPVTDWDVYKFSAAWGAFATMARVCGLFLMSLLHEVVCAFADMCNVGSTL